MRRVSVFFIAITMLWSCKTQNMFSHSKSNDLSEIIVESDTACEHIIGPDDRISVSVWGHDDVSVGSIYSIYNSNEVYGKWIQLDQDGTLILPQLGKVALAGMTVPEANAFLEAKYAELLIKPTVNVKVHNLNVSVLGEVNHPGNYELGKYRNTITEVIAKAGGATFYANKKKVKLLRKDKEYHLDLTRMSAAEMYKINIQRGDVLYIPSKGGKVVDKKSPTFLALSGVLTTGLLILSLFTAKQ